MELTPWNSSPAFKSIVFLTSFRISLTLLRMRDEPPKQGTLVTLWSSVVLRGQSRRVQERRRGQRRAEAGDKSRPAGRACAGRAELVEVGMVVVHVEESDVLKGWKQEEGSTMS